MSPSRLSRLNMRFKLRNITIFFMISRTQTTTGITSKIGPNQHIVLWDLDHCNIQEASTALIDVQKKYNLSDIYIFGDRDNGFGAICFKVVPFITMLRILIDTNYIDEGFISYTAKRNKATLRMWHKENRPMMKVKNILHTYHLDMPENMEKIIYDTGLVKDGVTLGCID